jgi:hypothetical protein
MNLVRYTPSPILILIPLILFLAYTEMMLDAIFGICRICGNHPGSTSTPKDCRPVMPDLVLELGGFDPFSTLPEDTAPRMHSLMHHCMSGSFLLVIFLRCQASVPESCVPFLSL